MLKPAAIVPSPELRQRHGGFFASHRGADGRFFNPWGATPRPDPRQLWRWRTGHNPWAQDKRRPPEVPCERHPRERFIDLEAQAGLRVMWLGHASCLVAIEGRHLLIDPIFGRAAGVVARATPAPLLPETLPHIDAVLLTHGHYDHCDLRSLRALASRFGPTLELICPLGLGAVLPRGSRVTELDWWQQVRMGEVEITLVPSQHWYKRGVFDTNRALWGGWYMRCAQRAIYHCGDTGHFEGFAVIREVLGAPDIALLPAGAYEPRWFMGPQHMAPEETVAAFETLGAQALVPMHWGTFDLSDEPLTQGVDILRAQLAGREGLVVVEQGGTLGLDGTGRLVL